MHRLTLIGIIIIALAIIMGLVSFFEFTQLAFHGFSFVTLPPNGSETISVPKGNLLALIYNSTGISYEVINGTPLIKTTQSNGRYMVGFTAYNSSVTVKIFNANPYPVNVTVYEQKLSTGVIYAGLVGLGIVLFLVGIALIIIGVILGRRRRL